jgi:tetratricopeptide (TPR) repeat protein
LAVLGLLWGFQDRVGRGPAAAVLFFAVAVVPVALVNVAFTRLSYVADHWQYWASMGLIALVVGSLALGWTRWRPSWAPQGSGVLASVLVLLVLSGLTWRRARVYESPMTLWSDTLAQNPDAWVAHNNLGDALAARGYWGTAAACYRRAIELYPRSAKAHYNLGTALDHLNRRGEAIVEYRRALGIDADFAQAHYNLANALWQLDHCVDAVRQYRLATRADPDFALAQANLGAALLALGRPDDAIGPCRTALRLDATLDRARHNLHVALAEPAGQAPSVRARAASEGF